MSDEAKFNAQEKKQQGTVAARECRRAGMIPAIIYGGPLKEKSIAVSSNEFEKEYKKGNFRTRLIKIVLDGKEVTAIARDIQRDPVSDLPIHIDFQEVIADSLVKMAIRTRVINEDLCPGIKRGGVVNLVYRTITMMCPANNIPHFIDIDVEGMQIGENRHISDIKLPEGASPVKKGDFTILSIGGSADDDEAEAADAEGEAEEGAE